MTFTEEQVRAVLPWGALHYIDGWHAVPGGDDALAESEPKTIHGFLFLPPAAIWGRLQVEPRECGRCDGSRHEPSENVPCDECHGTGTIDPERELRLFVAGLLEKP